MLRRALAGGIITLFMMAGDASAQIDAAHDVQRGDRLLQLQQFELDTRLRANTAIPADQRALFDYGGYFSPQYFSIDDANHDNHGLRELDLVGYVRANFDGANEFFARGRLQYNDYNPGDSFDLLGSRMLDPDLDRAYYKFDLQQFESAYNGKSINGDVLFEGGRDLVYWGNGLTIAQVLDGVMPAFSWGKVSLSTVAGVTPTRTVDIQPDRPDFDHNTRRGFYGALLSASLGMHHPFVYGLLQRDYNGHNVAFAGSSLGTGNPVTTRYSYNSAYLGIGSNGSLSDHLRYGVEAVYESGNSLSNSFALNSAAPGLIPIPQTRDNIEAYAGDVKVDYVPQDLHNSRFTVEGIAASGDTDRGLTNTTFNGNKPFSHDRAFNGFGLLSTGLAFGSPVSNLLVLRVGASTFPVPTMSAFRRLQVGTDLYVFGKPNEGAPIDTPTSRSSGFLGWEPDLYVNWEVASDVTLAFRYGAFIPNSDAFADSRARQFFYAGATFAF